MINTTTDDLLSQKKKKKSVCSFETQIATVTMNERVALQVAGGEIAKSGSGATHSPSQPNVPEIIGVLG